VNRRTFIALLSGSAAAWPMTARGQSATIPVIGFLHSGTAEQNANRLNGFRRGLSDAGFTENQNVTIEYRWAEGQNARLPELAADLVRRNVAVIVAVSSQPATLAAKAATSTIPIVFTWPGDPITAGLVASLNRPGGNATGIGTLNDELAAKRFGLLRELVPQASPIFVLFNPADPSAEAMSRDLQVQARALGVQMQLLYAGTDSEIDAAFANLAVKPGGALLVNADPFFFIRRVQITALAARHAVPAIYYDREFAVSGGLTTYGTDLPSAWGRPATMLPAFSKARNRPNCPSRNRQNSSSSSTSKRPRRSALRWLPRCLLPQMR